MHQNQPISPTPGQDCPRHPQEEIAELLAVALLRLRARGSASAAGTTPHEKDAVDLGFTGHQRVNANPDHQEGIRP